MRTDNNSLFAAISNDQMNQLVKEVKETVATELQVNNGKAVFSAADLWKIQNNRRPRVQRRTMFC